MGGALALQTMPQPDTLPLCSPAFLGHKNKNIPSFLNTHRHTHWTNTHTHYQQWQHASKFTWSDLKWKLKKKKKFIQKVWGTKAERSKTQEDAPERMPKPSKWGVCTFQCSDLMLDGPEEVLHRWMSSVNVPTDYAKSITFSHSLYFPFAKATVILCRCAHTDCKILLLSPSLLCVLTVLFSSTVYLLYFRLALTACRPHPQAHVPRRTCSCVNLCSVPLPLFILHYTEPTSTWSILSEPVTFLTFSSRSF